MKITLRELPVSRGELSFVGEKPDAAEVQALLSQRVRLRVSLTQHWWSPFATVTAVGPLPAVEAARDELQAWADNRAAENSW